MSSPIANGPRIILDRLPWKKVLVVSSILALGLGYLAHCFRERAIVAELEAQGAIVGYYYGHVAEIRFAENSDFSDADMERLLQLRDVESLSLENTRVTSAGTARLGDLKALTRLDLYRDQMTDSQELNLRRLNGQLAVSRYKSRD